VSQPASAAPTPSASPNAGFTDIEITDSHSVADGFWSAFVRAPKPSAARQ